MITVLWPLVLIRGVSQTQVQQLGLRFAGDDGANVDSCSVVQVAVSQAGGSWLCFGDTEVAVLAQQ